MPTDQPDPIEAAKKITRLTKENNWLRTVIVAYSTIQAARRIAEHPPDKCLECVAKYWRQERAAEAAKGASDE